VLVADPSYRLDISREDLAALGLSARGRPRIAKDVLCLAVVSVGPEGPTANLLAPLVVNLRNGKAVQALCAESGYSHRCPLVSGEPARQDTGEAVPC
jgi:flagellar assembly factor FliW